MARHANPSALDPRVQLGLLSYVVISMITGVLLFGGIVVGLVLKRDGGAAESRDLAQTLAIVLVSLAAAEAVAWWIIRAALLRSWQRAAAKSESPARAELDLSDKEAAAPWVQRFFAYTIIPAAMGEGLALFAVVAALLTRNPWFFAGSAVGIVATALCFPSEQRLQQLVRHVASPHLL